ncbi:hypothetical protein H6P81_006505 [Aristolochia fimbriata]|uniref:Protein kinase domain-containing protein n=1 Tax=Aristolochia fimbriata TaxID=158543 RepID=A0AAV7F175_ARIFI|nr:hypothetical protein H6P81_006505 [Aristolochia fimbriata]
MGGDFAGVFLAGNSADAAISHDITRSLGEQGSATATARPAGGNSFQGGDFAGVFLAGNNAGAAISHHIDRRLGEQGSATATTMPVGAILVHPFSGGQGPREGTPFRTTTSQGSFSPGTAPAAPSPTTSPAASATARPAGAILVHPRTHEMGPKDEDPRRWGFIERIWRLTEKKVRRGVQERFCVREEKGIRLGKYELGQTLGEGNFGKMKYAKNLDSGKGFAVKILEKKREK